MRSAGTTGQVSLVRRFSTSPALSLGEMVMCVGSVTWLLNDPLSKR
mgnify:CR=1 FL=1